MTVKLWISGARPKTLTTSLSSVAVGACCAYPVIVGDLNCAQTRSDTSQCAAVTADAQAMIAAGANRIGASSGVALVSGAAQPAGDGVAGMQLEVGDITIARRPHLGPRQIQPRLLQRDPGLFQLGGGDARLGERLLARGLADHLV